MYLLVESAEKNLNILSFIVFSSFYDAKLFLILSRIQLNTQCFNMLIVQLGPIINPDFTRFSSRQNIFANASFFPFLQSFSIACYAEPCISYIGLSVRLSVRLYVPLPHAGTE